MLSLISIKARINQLVLVSTRYISKISGNNRNNYPDYTKSIEDQYFPSFEDIKPIVNENTFELDIKEFNNELKALFGDLSMTDPLTFNTVENYRSIE